MAGGSSLRDAQKRLRQQKKQSAAGLPSEAQRPSKRPREESAAAPANVSAQPPSSSLAPPSSSLRGSALPGAESPAPRQSSELFAPSFRTLKGVPIKKSASVRENKKVAVTLLKGLSLPRDLEQIPKGIGENYVDLCADAVRVGQDALAIGDKILGLSNEKLAAEHELAAERKSHSEDLALLEGLRKKVDILSKEKSAAEQRAITAESLVSDAEKKLSRAQAEHVENLRAADENGYQRGEKETLTRFAQEAMDNEEKAFKKGYLLGFSTCWPAAVGRGLDMAEVPSESPLRSIPEAPEPDVPEMPFEEDAEEEVPEDAGGAGGCGEEGNRGGAEDAAVEA